MTQSAPVVPSPRLVTIGHSTRALDELVALLRHHGVRGVADVRTVPRSRRHPHVWREALAASLPATGIAYRHFPGLGGLRRPRLDSPNGGWRNGSFRGYADYMLTEEFRLALHELLNWVEQTGPTAVMCAEAVPWRCHRSLIADALLARGIVAHHAIDRAPARPHRLTPFARVEGTEVTYPSTPGPSDAGGS
jgi:uncharacterized protein (DUF488 family)